MAKTKRTKRKFGDKLEFVVNNLSAAQLEEFDAIKDKMSLVDELLSNAVDKGFDVKIAYDDYSKCVQTTAIGNWNGFDNAGLATSARSDDVWDALGILAYKVCVICEWNLAPFTESGIERNIRG